MDKKLLKLLQEAGAALNNFDWPRAGELYSNILKEQPDNAGALMGVAMLCNRSGKHAQALEILRRIWLAIEKAPAEQQAEMPNSTKAEILAQMALAMELLKQTEQAVMLYKAAHDLYAAPRLLQRIAALQGNDGVQPPVARLVEKAQKLAAQKNLAGAMQTYREALQLNADHDKALHGLGDLHRQRGEFQLALPLIQQAIIMQPGVAEYHNTLGMLFQQKGEHEKALIFHRRAVDIDTKYAAAHCNLGVALKNLNRLPEAIAEYRKALEIAPKMAEAHNNLGNLLRIQGDVKGAAASLKQALKLRPGYADAQRNLDALKTVAGKPAAKPAVAAVATAKGKKKPATKKTVVKKAAAKNVAVKKPAKKAAVKKAVAKKTVAKKPVATNPVVKKQPVKAKAAKAKPQQAKAQKSSKGKKGKNRK